MSWIDGMDRAHLLEVLAKWASPKEVTVYLYGSRARQDERRDSDVDIHIQWSGVSSELAAWWSHANSTDFADLKIGLPGRLEILDGPESLKRAIESGKVLARIKNVVAIDLPAKPLAT